jgi:hypothetical protein
MRSLHHQTNMNGPKFFQHAVHGISSYLSQNSLDDVLVTIEKLALPIEEAYIAADPNRIPNPDNLTEDLLYSLWSGILSVAQSVPSERQSSLVSILARLKGRPSPILNDSKRREVLQASYRPWSIDKGNLWGELTMFQWSTRESFDAAYTKKGASEGQNRWMNLNRFLAQLTAQGVSDESFLGLVVLREGLEGENFGAANDNNGRTAVLLAASIWIVNVGKFWSERGWDKMGPNRGPSGSLWRGDVFKIDTERIGLWRKRCEDLSVTEADEAVKESLKEAAQMRVK